MRVVSLAHSGSIDRSICGVVLRCPASFVAAVLRAISLSLSLCRYFSGFCGFLLRYPASFVAPRYGKLLVAFQPWAGSPRTLSLSISLYRSICLSRFCGFFLRCPASFFPARLAQLLPRPGYGSPRRFGASEDLRRWF